MLGSKNLVGAFHTAKAAIPHLIAGEVETDDAAAREAASLTRESDILKRY